MGPRQLLPVMFSLTVMAMPVTGAQSLPEEIIVNPEINMSRLKSQLNQAAVDMFNVYNELNDDDRFDIHCKMVRRWQSKIREHVCTPVYFETAREDEAEIMLRQLGYAGIMATGPGVTVLDRNNAILEKKMKAIFEQSPEFIKALNHYNSVAEQLEQQRQVMLHSND